MANTLVDQNFRNLFNFIQNYIAVAELAVHTRISTKKQKQKLKLTQ